MKTEFVFADGTDDQRGAYCCKRVAASIFLDRDHEALRDTHLGGCICPWHHDRENETVNREQRGLRHAGRRETLAGVSGVTRMQRKTLTAKPAFAVGADEEVFVFFAYLLQVCILKRRGSGIFVQELVNSGGPKKLTLGFVSFRLEAHLAAAVGVCFWRSWLS